MSAPALARRQAPGGGEAAAIARALARQLADPELLELLAEALAARLAAPLAERIAERARPPELLSAAEVAEHFGVDREWVYRNAERLGALRIGAGPRPRLRFDPERIAAILAGEANGRRGSGR